MAPIVDYQEHKSTDDDNRNTNFMIAQDRGVRNFGNVMHVQTSISPICRGTKSLSKMELVVVVSLFE